MNIGKMRKYNRRKRGEVFTTGMAIEIETFIDNFPYRRK